MILCQLKSLLRFDQFLLKFYVKLFSILDQEKLKKITRKEKNVTFSFVTSLVASLTDKP
jgi:hypothetical protein